MTRYHGVACLGILCVLLCAPLVRAKNYAVLISAERATADDAVINCEFWYDLVLQYTTLLDEGYRHDDIHVLYGLGTDFNSSHACYQVPYPVADYSVSRANIQSVLSMLSSVMTPDDFVYVWWMGHGSTDGDHLVMHIGPTGEIVYDYEFANWMDPIDHDVRSFSWMTCHSGGILDDLEGASSIVMSSATFYELTASDWQCDSWHAEFHYPETCAWHWETPCGICGPVNADGNGSGRVSFHEAFTYADAHTTQSHPQMSDLGGLAPDTYLRPPQTFVVSPDGSGDFPTIQAAIDAAIDGDIIELANGTFTGAGNRDIGFLGKAITVRSQNGPYTCIIDCEGDPNDPHRGFYFHSGETDQSVLEGLTIEGGYVSTDSPGGPHGGAVHCDDSSPTLLGCRFTLSEADSCGGGVYSSAGSPTVEACEFDSNWANKGAGFCGLGADAALDGSWFGQNWSWASGGAIYSESCGTLTVLGCVFDRNGADLSGGGIYSEFCGVLFLMDCVFDNNWAIDSGGGVYTELSDGLTVESCTFNANSAAFGGGIWALVHDNLSITYCTFAENEARAVGGGLASWCSSDTILRNCSFTRNTACFEGGAMHNEWTDGLLTDCTFTRNSAVEIAGGICNVGNCHWTLANCAFEQNWAAYHGGAMHNCLGASPILANCIFVGNWSADHGAGVSNDTGCRPELANCTFGANWASVGRAISACGAPPGSESSVTLANCILWDGGDEVWSNDDSTIAITYSDVQGGWPGMGNIDRDPRFVDPDPNSGDYHLRPHSPCIDAACNWTLPADIADLDNDGDVTEITPLDLDGEGRFFDDPNSPDAGCGFPPIVDMGAYEFGGAGPQPCLGDFNGDHAVDLADLATLLAHYRETEVCEGDLDCDGDVDLEDLAALLAVYGTTCP